MLTKLGRYPGESPAYRDEGPSRGRITGSLGGYAVPMALAPHNGIPPKLPRPGDGVGPKAQCPICHGRSMALSSLRRHNRRAHS